MEQKIINWKEMINIDGEIYKIIKNEKSAI